MTDKKKKEEKTTAKKEADNKDALKAVRAEEAKAPVKHVKVRPTVTQRVQYGKYKYAIKKDKDVDLPVEVAEWLRATKRAV